PRPSSLSGRITDFPASFRSLANSRMKPFWKPWSGGLSICRKKTKFLKTKDLSMKTKKKSTKTWGGARPGAGRKPKPDAEKRRVTCMTVQLERPHKSRYVAAAKKRGKT